MKYIYRRECFSKKLYGKELPVFSYKEIDSTNEEAKRFLADGSVEQALFVAESQTAGKGRRGRSFYSPAGKGIYMSLLFTTQEELSDVIFVTTAVAVIVACALEEVTSTPAVIKWVNDIYMNNRKVCGILTEAVLPTEQCHKTGVVVGIGINVSTDNFPDELRMVAGSLGVKAQEQEVKEALIQSVTEGLIDFLEHVKDHSCIEEYRKRSMVLGQSVICFDGAGSYEAKALDIDKQGGLIVETLSGERKVLHTGEITIRLCEP